jgi:hypothetical protein
MAASLVTKFMDYIEELDDFGDISFGVSDSNTQAIDAAKRITDAFENEGDFKEDSKYMQNADKYIKPLYNACVACPNENPVNIWKAIRSANDSQLNQLNNILETNAGQDAISKWVSIGNKPPIKDDRKNPIDDTLTGTDPNQEALRRLAHNDSEEKTEPAKTAASKSPATMSNVLELSGLDELPADDSGNLANIPTVEDDDEVEFPKTDEEKAAQKAAVQAERQAKKEQAEKEKQERAAAKAAEKEVKAAQKEEQKKLKEAEKAQKEAERLAQKEAEAKARADKKAAKEAESKRKAEEAAALKAQKEAAKAAAKQAAAQKVTSQIKPPAAVAPAKPVAPAIQQKPAATIDQARFDQLAAALDDQLNIEIPNDEQASSSSIPDETAAELQSGEPAEQAADAETTEQQQQQQQPQPQPQQQQQSDTISIPAQPSEQETDDARTELADNGNQGQQIPTDAATVKPAEQSAAPAVTPAGQPVKPPVKPTVVHTPVRPARQKPTVEPTPAAEEPEDETPEIPETGNPRDEFSDLYDEIDNLSISSEQAEEAKRYADVVFSNPNTYPREYAVLSGNASKTRTRCVEAMLATANKRLGYKEPVSGKKKDTLDFQSGVVSQSKGRTRVGASLVMPSGFGLKKNAAIWNTPVITDFGYPFLNFSSEAMLSVIKSKKDDEELKNHNLKKMFKDAAKRYGGVWKAIYSSPLTLLRQIATDVGIKCTPKYLKIDGSDLINSDSGENVTVIPIKYYSIDPEFEGFINVPRDFLTSFYDVIDYSSTSKRMYLKYAQGMSEEEFAEEITENRGVPPFYILVPKQAKFSKCHIRSGSLLGSLMNLILGRKKCTMVKTVFQGKRGCLAMETDTANTLYADI